MRPTLRRVGGSLNGGSDERARVLTMPFYKPGSDEYEHRMLNQLASKIGDKTVVVRKYPTIGFFEAEANRMAELGYEVVSQGKGFAGISVTYRRTAPPEIQRREA